jgi:hypothetical protein
VCGYCTGPIVGRALGSLYCSRDCATNVMAQRRRAARQGKPVHRIRPADIFERDDWVCHLCTRPIDRVQRGKHPLAPALDHLIPVAHPDYPGHIAANLAAAHWACNTAKGARVTADDFALYARLAVGMPPGEPVARRHWTRSSPGTHCSFGHEFTEENTYVRPDGKGRQCKKCIRRRARAQYAREDIAVKEARLVALRASRPRQRRRAIRPGGTSPLFEVPA